MAFPVGWTGKKKVTIDNTKVSGSTNLTDFPVLIADSNIPDDAYAAMLSTGADIRFSSDISGTTELPFQIVALDTTAKTAEIWVKVPSVSHNTDTIIYMWYGNGSASAYSASDTYGSQNVWNSNFKGVWHLQEASGTRNDSTVNVNHLTDNNTVASGTGKIKTGADFELSNSEYLSRTDAAQTGLDITGNITKAFWFKPESTPGASVYQTLISKYNNNGVNQRGYYIAYRNSGGVGLEFTVSRDGTSSTISQLAHTVTLTNGTWYHIAVARDSTSGAMKILIDGASVATGTPTAGAMHDSTDSFLIGAQNTGTVSYTDGVIDEARVLNTVLTNDWIATEYANQNAPSTFLSMSNASEIKSVNTITLANIKSINGLVIANVKSVNGVA